MSATVEQSFIFLPKTNPWDTTIPITTGTGTGTVCLQSHKYFESRAIKWYTTAICQTYNDFNWSRNLCGQVGLIDNACRSLIWLNDGRKWNKTILTILIWYVNLVSMIFLRLLRLKIYTALSQIKLQRLSVFCIYICTYVYCSVFCTHI